MVLTLRVIRRTIRTAIHRPRAPALATRQPPEHSNLRRAPADEYLPVVIGHPASVTRQPPSVERQPPSVTRARPPTTASPSVTGAHLELSAGGKAQPAPRRPTLVGRRGEVVARGHAPDVGGPVLEPGAGVAELGGGRPGGQGALAGGLARDGARGGARRVAHHAPHPLGQPPVVRGAGQQLRDRGRRAAVGGAAVGLAEELDAGVPVRGAVALGPVQVRPEDPLALDDHRVAGDEGEVVAQHGVHGGGDLRGAAGGRRLGGGGAEGRPLPNRGEVTQGSYNPLPHAFACPPTTCNRPSNRQ